MKRKGFALFLAALLTALALSACGGGAGGSTTAASSSKFTSGGDAASADYNSVEYSGGTGGGDWGFYAEDAAEPSAPREETEAQEEPRSDRLANAKMVYTANIEAETMDFDACAADLEALVEELGGYMEYASASSYSDGLRAGSYTARIPSARFTTFLKSVGDLSHIVDQSKSSENISERYYDTESRLTTQKTKLERLQMLLARAENMEDIIALESAIAETELQIEQLTGSLRHYDALVDFATIEIRLREVSRLTTVEEAPPSFASRLGNAFADGLYSFRNFLQILAIFLAYNWAWLVLLAVIVFLGVRVSRGRRAKMEETFRQARERGPGLFRRKEQEEPKKTDDKQPKD